MTLVLIGFLLGLLSATVTESLGHKLFGHPSYLQRKLYFRYPRLFAPFLKPHYQHLVIHHHKTFRHDFFKQFKDEQEKAALDAWIRRKFPKKFADLIFIERYNLTLKGIGGTLPFAIPFFAGPILIGLALGPLALIGSIFTAFIPVWMSKYLHPLVHLPQESHQAGPFIRWLMKTQYMRRVFRNHYLHHQHLDTNFNLLLGGDYLVFLHRPATPKEEAELSVLLPEFDRKVREAPQPESVSSITREQISQREREYLALENPNYEQRFQHLRWKSQVLDAAQSQGWEDILDLRNEGRVNFGMRLYEKGISLATWCGKKEFSIEAYQRDGDSVTYRGARFETGDILLTNQACDSDGLFSTLLEGNFSFSHVAVFAILSHEGRELPAAIEINEYGVRAVPLKAFLSDRFNTYVEIFRSRTPISSEARAAIGKAAIEIMAESHAFDIYQDDTQSVYLNCARTVAEIYRRAGLVPIRGSSRYSQKTFRNLEILGIHASANKDLMMPDDYSKDPQFRIVGTVDNGRFNEIMARGLVRDRIQEIWQTKVLDRRRYPIEYPLVRFIIESIQKGTWLSPLLLKLTGLKRDQFPSGPPVFLSLTPAGNRRMAAATRKVARELAANRLKITRIESWTDLKKDMEIRELVVEASSGFRGMYGRQGPARRSRKRSSRASRKSS